MIEFALPWAFLVLPLPLLVYWLMPATDRRGGAALHVPFFDALARLPRPGAEVAAGRRAKVAVKAVAWIALVTAAAQPSWVGDPLPIPTRGRDLMLAMDLSASMAERDFEVNGHTVDRHSVVNAVAKQFVREREGDRIGLILFGSRAYLQAPLTADRETVVQMLDESELGLAGRETAIGDAIGLAVKHLRERPSEQRVLVLLSDGASNTGALDPMQAASLAKQTGVRIYTIGVGSGAVTIDTPFGRRTLQGSELDEATLRRVAEETGGQYFRADDTASLIRVYEQINQLEPTEGEAAYVRPTRALFYWPLAVAFLLAAALAVARLLVPLVPALSTPMGTVAADETTMGGSWA